MSLSTAVSFSPVCVSEKKRSVLNKVFKKTKIVDGKQMSSSLFTCQQAVNDEKTNIYEKWPELVEVGGCFPRTLTDGHKP